MKPIIFVIEDSKADLFFLEAIIESIGKYDVVSAMSGEEARDKLTKVPIKNIALVLMDLSLPGTGGLDLLNEMKNSYPSLPIIISSGSKRKEDVVQALRLGASDYITKPVREERLLTCLKNIERIQHLQDNQSVIHMLDEQNHIKPMKNLEYEIVLEAMRLCDDNISKAAQCLGMTRATFYKKLKNQ